MHLVQHLIRWKAKNNNSSTTASELWRNAGPSAFQLQVSMLKSDKIWRAYLVVNCASLLTFWTPLVCSFNGSTMVRLLWENLLLQKHETWRTDQLWQCSNIIKTRSFANIKSSKQNHTDNDYLPVTHRAFSIHSLWTTMSVSASQQTPNTQV